MTLTGSMSASVRQKECRRICKSVLFYAPLVASVARHIYLRPGCGVGALKTLYGSRKNRGNRPSHHAESSGSVARKALQSLEKLKLLEKDPEGYGDAFLHHSSASILIF
jgi:ribosomal protein S19E (S16A)